MRLRDCLAAVLAAVPGLASAGPTVILLNSPTGGDKVLASAAQKGEGPPAQGLWIRTTVTVNPKTGAKTTVTIVASHPVANPPPKLR